MNQRQEPIQIKTRKGETVTRKATISGQYAQVGIWLYKRNGGIYERY